MDINISELGRNHLPYNEYTKKDNEALENKLNKPSERVICPRCGRELFYRKAGNSEGVYCPTFACLYLGIRGL